MQSRIVGTTMPVLEVMLQPNEAVISEAGELSWMTQSIQMTTHTQMAGGGGFFGAIKRVAGGGTLFMTEYTAMGYPGEIAFATKVPGHILPVEVGAGHEYFVHRHGYLCSTAQVQLGVGFQQSLGAGIFGGDGFLLQKITGFGTAWLELSGEVVVKDLRAGETLRVHPGHVGAFSGGISFQITRVPGIKNLIFGPGGADRAGAGVATDAANLATGASDPGVRAGRIAAGDRAGRRCGRDCRVASGRDESGVRCTLPWADNARRSCDNPMIGGV
jgi:uncharacterized protein (AIM24 family)